MGKSGRSRRTSRKRERGPAVGLPPAHSEENVMKLMFKTAIAAVALIGAAGMAKAQLYTT